MCVCVQMKFGGSVRKNGLKAETSQWPTPVAPELWNDSKVPKRRVITRLFQNCCLFVLLLCSNESKSSPNQYTSVVFFLNLLVRLQVEI